MRNVWSAIAIAPVIFSPSSESLAASEDSFVVTQAVANVQVAPGQTVPLFQEAYASSRPFKGQIQYRYIPPLIPFRTALNEVKVDQYDSIDGKQVLSITFSVGSDELSRYGASALVAHGVNPEASPDNVRPVPVQDVEFTIKDLDGAAGVTVKSPPTGFIGGTVKLNIIASDKAVAGRVRDVLKHADVQYTYTYQARSAQQNATSLKMDELRSTLLAAKLNGLPDAGGGTRYIHRDDMRKLLVHVANEIRLDRILTGPTLQTAPDVVLKGILELWSSKDDVKNFNGEQLKSTYDGNDLVPDKIEHSIDKNFEKDQGKDSWHLKADAKIDTGFDMVDLFKANFGAQASVDTDKFREWLKEHDVSAEFNGTKWVVKDVYVVRANTSDFQLANRYVTLDVVLGEVKSVRVPSVVSLENPTLSAQSFGERLVQLSAKLDDFCLGCVVSSTLSDAVFRATNGAGWVLCDGQAISGSKLANRAGITNAPDLRGAFLRGKNFSRFADSPEILLGAYSPDTVGPHTHPLNDPGHQHPVMVAGNQKAEVGLQYSWQQISIQNDKLSQPAKTGITILSNDGMETAPKSVTVNWYIKVN